jgi:hypothetical protein
MQGNLTVLFFLPTLTSLVYRASPTYLVGADDVEYHISKTLGRPRKSLRKWSPLQILQGNLDFIFFIVVLSTSSTLPIQLTVAGSLDPTYDVVGGLVPFWFFFFFSFHFFFLLSTWLLGLELSLGEEG